MKLKECKKGNYYKLDNYRICEILESNKPGLWLDIYEAWSDDTYKFSEKCSSKGLQDIDVTPVKAKKEGYRVCLL